jgi:integrase
LAKSPIFLLSVLHLVIFLNAATFLALGVSALKGADFLKISLWDPSSGSAYSKSSDAWYNTVHTTSLRHLTALQRFQLALRTHDNLRRMPLADAALSFLKFQKAKARSPWTAQTHFRELTNLHGAMSTLGKYSTNADFPINMSESATWKASLTAWRRKASQSQPAQLSAATPEDIQTAIDLNTDPEMRVYLMVLWLLCGRKGDAAKIRAQDVVCNEKNELVFFVQEGKGVIARKGKYHVATALPPQWRQELLDFTAKQKSSGLLYLFRPSLRTSGEANEALRLANPKLSTRSVRRGALQIMASSPDVDLKIVMEMAGHKNVETTKRYLNWGAVDAKNQKAYFAASKLLIPKPRSQQQPTPIPLVPQQVPLEMPKPRSKQQAKKE